MKKFNLAIGLCFLYQFVICQNEKVALDTVLLTDICVENISFGDSVSKLFYLFGKPDTVIYRPMGDWEFEEPTHKMYFYDNDIFYEILYPNLSEGLIYGCRISTAKMTVKIRVVSMVIGETRIETMQEYFPQTAKIPYKIGENEYMFSLFPTIPPNLKSLESAFINNINLYFKNGVLRQIWTPLDKN